MGFLDSEFGKMILFIILGIIFAIVLLGYHKSPKADLASALKRKQSSKTLARANTSENTSKNPYEPEL